jgi:hypothetical protein
VLLLGEVLEPLAPSDEFLSVAQSCGPVESSSESLADQRVRRRVVAADAFMDLLQDVLCRMDLPGPTTSVGTRTDYSVGPWDYPACATRHLMA